MCDRYQITAYSRCRRNGKTGLYARAAAIAETPEKAEVVRLQLEREHPGCMVKITVTGGKEMCSMKLT